MAKKQAKKHRPRPLLVKLRIDAGLTQEQLAKAIRKIDGGKLGKTSVSHWEQGASFPKRSRLPSVASALGITVERLLEVA